MMLLKYDRFNLWLLTLTNSGQSSHQGHKEGNSSHLLKNKGDIGYTITKCVNLCMIGLGLWNLGQIGYSSQHKKTMHQGFDSPVMASNGSSQGHPPGN